MEVKSLCIEITRGKKLLYFDGICIIPLSLRAMYVLILNFNIVTLVYRNFITDFTSIHILITIFLPKRSGTGYIILHIQLFRLLGASTCQQCYFFGNDRSKRWKAFNSTMFVCCKINKKVGIYFDSFFWVYFSTFFCGFRYFRVKI